MRWKALFFVIVFGPAFGYGATPSITNVTGSFSGQANSSTTANIITITGASFGSKSPAPPLVWGTFEDGTTNFTNIGSSTVDGVENLASTTTNQRSGSTYGVLGSWAAQANDSFSFWIEEGTAFDKWYIFYRRRYSFAPTGNQKVFRSFESGSASSGRLLNSFQGAAEFRMYDENVDPLQSGSFTGSGAAYTTDVLHVEEILMDDPDNVCSGDPSVGNATIILRRDGSEVRNKTDFCISEDIKTVRLIENATPGGSEPTPESTAFVWMDDIYFDSVWSRVLLMDASSYASATSVEVLPAKTWSATQITAYFNQGANSANDTRYVVVCNEDAIESCSSGYEITIGQNMTGETGVFKGGGSLQGGFTIE